MNIISKEKKEIRWLGLPTNSQQECIALEKDKIRRAAAIKQKMKQLGDLILQQIAFKNLVERNRNDISSNGQPGPNSSIQLPFILVHTAKDTTVDCSISSDKWVSLDFAIYINFDQYLIAGGSICLTLTTNLKFTTTWKCWNAWDWPLAWKKPTAARKTSCALAP